MPVGSSNFPKFFYYFVSTLVSLGCGFHLQDACSTLGQRRQPLISVSGVPPLLGCEFPGQKSLPCCDMWLAPGTVSEQ